MNIIEVVHKGYNEADYNFNLEHEDVKAVIKDMAIFSDYYTTDMIHYIRVSEFEGSITIDVEVWDENTACYESVSYDKKSMYKLDEIFYKWKRG